MPLDKCLRCGQCCKVTYKGITKECKHLARENGKTYCRIYNHRLGTTMFSIHNTNFYCLMRENSQWDYLDCPYNTNKQIMRQ
jgi:hypothetical protein